jgi:hypothetical protein
MSHVLTHKHNTV